MLMNYSVVKNMNDIGKIAISVLTKGYSDISQYQMLIDRNNAIFDKIVNGSKYDFDLIIFHEGNITNEHQTYISSKSNSPIIFKDIRYSGNGNAFNSDRNIINAELCPPNSLSSWFELGYKHMCYFWSIDLFDYLSEYKYVIRIDEDVVVTKFDESVLNKIVNDNIKFAAPLFCYYNGKLDDPDVMVGLQKLTEDFYEKYNHHPDISFDDILGCYTNFMILDLDYFRNHNLVQSYLKDVSECNCIYSNRWGDASIWGIIVQALIDEPYYTMDTVQYYHGSHNRYVNLSEY